MSDMTLPEKPMLIRTLSDQHWNASLFELLKNDQSKIKAGMHGCWSFFIKARGQGVFEKCTYIGDREVKVEKLSPIHP